MTRARARCAGTKRDGEPCGAHAGPGGYCVVHGGALPSVCDREHANWAARKWLGKVDAQPVTDTLKALQQLAGDLEAAREAAWQRVTELGGDARYEHAKAGEQLRGEVEVWLRLTQQSARLLSDIAKIGIEERRVRLAEEQCRLVEEAFARTLIEAGFQPEIRHTLVLSFAARIRGGVHAIKAAS